MERWLGLDEIPEAWGPSVVTIGVFDGVHRGHQRIVVRAAEAARELGLPLVVVTFDPHPSEVIRPGSHPALLCSLRRRVQLLAEFGADAVCVLPFTLEFSHLSPGEFVQAVLVDRLHARRVVVGENFRFGYRAAGDLALLAELALIPLARAAADAFPSRQLTGDEAKRLAHGGRLPGGTGHPGPEAAFAPDGTLIALVEEKDGQTRPVVVFVP